jgi:integrase/recombinase XerD
MYRYIHRAQCYLNHYLQQKASAKWSRTHTCWYLPCTEKNYEQLCCALREKVVLDVLELKKYLSQRKNSKPTPVAQTPTIKKPPIFKPAQKIINRQQRIIYKLSADNNDALQKFKQQLILKSYSPSTIRTYENEFRQFLQTIKDVPARDFTTQRIKDYLQYCFEKLKLSENTLHSRMNSLKFYYEQVLKREKFFWEIPRPKKPLILPKLLNENELRKLFNALTNKKHKAMLFTTYSAGLRVSEIVNLKIAHIDSKRMQIFVERAKGSPRWIKKK